MVLVSVGVPVYNGEDCLAAAVASVLAQTHADLEVIISDNASTDGTESIGRALQEHDARVRYIRQPRNLGAPANWNVVARAARGTYFKWMSASDSCHPNFLARAVDCLERQADAVLCFAATQYVDDAGRIVGRADSDFAVAETSPSERFWRVCSGLQINNAQNGLIRRSALLQTRLDRLYPHGDRVLMAELAMLGKFVLLDEPMLTRRASPAHWTALRSEAELDRMFWPAGAPRRPLVHVRRLADYFISALRSPVAVSERLKAAGHALRYAWWRQRDVVADLSTVLRPSPRRD
jgi:glycosyltransferase involved in cell wall biosynthesis